MTVYLVRHAVALSRKAWQGDDDDLRPLTPKGQRQAVGVAELLHEAPIRRVLSSPAVRCVETVRPLAEKLGVRVETTEVLQEGAPLEKASELLTKVARKKGDSVLCAHGDLIPALIEAVAREGTETGPVQWAKGSIWKLEWGHERFRSAAYLPPQSG
jgi:phosphohistidine phosphatase SixA